MPIISRVGHKSLKTRSLFTAMHLLLILGGFTMIYPILILLVSSIKSTADVSTFMPYPEYFFSEKAMFAKVMDRRNSEKVQYRNAELRENPLPTLLNISMPAFSRPVSLRPYFNCEIKTPDAESADSFAAFAEMGNNPVIFESVSYAISDNSKDLKTSCILLSSPDQKVTGIKVGHKLNEICFLHATDISISGKQVIKYIINYTDNSSVTIPVRVKKEIGSWNEAPALNSPQYEIAWRSARRGTNFTAAYRLRWNNPKPDVEVKSIDMVSVTGKTAIFAITGLELKHLDSPASQVTLADWNEFKKTLPIHYRRLLFSSISGYGRAPVARGQQLYIDFLKKKYQTVEKANRAYMTTFDSWPGFRLPIMDPYKGLPDNVLTSLRYTDWHEFLQTLPEDFIGFYPSDNEYRAYLTSKYIKNIHPGMVSKSPQRDKSLAYFKWKQFLTKVSSNDKNTLLTGYFVDLFGRPLSNFYDLALPMTLPANKAEAQVWTRFIRDRFPASFIELSGGENEWQTFLKKRYKNIADLNKAQKAQWKDFSEVNLPRSLPKIGSALRRDWLVFAKSEACPGKYLVAASAENLYLKFLQEKYGSLAKVNEKYKTQASSFAAIHPPCKLDGLSMLDKNYDSFLWNFIVGNYQFAFLNVIFQGLALPNTLLFCFMAVLAAITINPMAAYALSRFRLRHSNAFLLFFIATMAFPASVGMIPSFLLMKQLGLLNHLIALILPGLANGYSIFILKGFFDSLPEEMFEAARLDGASELTVFTRLVLPVSKPVLAVVALWAFMAAYSNFMGVFIYCPDPDKWTLMVYVTQSHWYDSMPVNMAVIAVSALLPLIFFISSQRILMRGIVIPSFK